jgi:hypothetical protein
MTSRPTHLGTGDPARRQPEDYTTHFRGQPAGVAVTVARNAAGQAQHVIVNHRPRSAVLLLARLCGEKFAGTPLAELFVTSAS